MQGCVPSAAMEAALPLAKEPAAQAPGCAAKPLHAKPALQGLHEAAPPSE